MYVLSKADLHPGAHVWMEDNGEAFKALEIKAVTILSVDSEALFYIDDAGGFGVQWIDRYNTDLTWRCWDELPDADTLAEEEWAA